MRCAGIIKWLGEKSICPCCRARVPDPEPYRYPARTQLRSAFLRERLNHRLSWSGLSTHIANYDGMTAFVHAFSINPAQPLEPAPSVRILSTSRGGSKVDELSKDPVSESAETEPPLNVEAEPGGSSSRRPAGSEMHSVSEREAPRHSSRPTSVEEGGGAAEGGD